MGTASTPKARRLSKGVARTTQSELALLKGQDQDGRLA